jgi:hypothetical protein
VKPDPWEPWKDVTPWTPENVLTSRPVLVALVTLGAMLVIVLLVVRAAWLVHRHQRPPVLSGWLLPDQPRRRWWQIRGVR